ncbi:MAG: radical SAM protein, partial [Lachnospiraceae bacterium]|nr:radical SAM protein [Lachnospiraceae bacterium]
QVGGIYGKLEVNNSGSLMELAERTLTLIRDICLQKDIRELHFECHWMHRNELPAYRAFFTDAGIAVKIKIGVETFDADFREHVLDKGIDETDPAVIADGFDEVCLLFGLSGQTVTSMRSDIETGLAHFERVCVNLMVANSTKIKPDSSVLENFMEHIYPFYRDDPRVDILRNNTDFGVGKDKHHE